MFLSDPFDNTPPAPNVGSVFTGAVHTIGRANVNIAADIVGQTIGGHVISIGSTVLLIGQTNPVENGVWIARAGGLVPIRPAQFDESVEVNGGCALSALFGTDAGKLFVLTTPPLITLGTTALSFQEKSAGQKTNF